MAIKTLIAILLFAVVVFAQDGTSPDTVYTFANGFGIHYGPVSSTYNGSFKGTFREYGGSCDPCLISDSCAVGDSLLIFRNYPIDTKTQHARSYVLLNTYDKLDTDVYQVDYCTLEVWINEINSGDGDSLWAVGFNPRRQATCDRMEIYSSDSCNYYYCGGNLTFTNTRGTNFYAGADTGVTKIPFNTSLMTFSDTTGVGLVNKVYFPFFPHNNPSDTNTFSTHSYADAGADMAKMIYWYSLKLVIDRAGKNYGTTRYGL